MCENYPMCKWTGQRQYKDFILHVYDFCFAFNCRAALYEVKVPHWKYLLFFEGKVSQMHIYTNSF